MEVSNFVLKLSGKAELPQDIEMGNNYHISLSGAVPKVEEHDNENGTVTRIYTFKPVKVELLDQLGNTLQLKDTRSKSQLFRARVFGIWKQVYKEEAFEELYDKLMDHLIEHAPDIIEMYRA